MSLNHYAKKAVLTAVSALTIGLAVTPASAASYQASDSDTFWLLAQKYAVPTATLMKMNPNVDPFNIYKGLSLTVPDKPAKPAAAASTMQTGAQTPGKASAKATVNSSSKTTANVKATVKTNVKATAKVAPASKMKAKAVVASTGKSMAYKHVITAKATAYTASTEENGKWGAVDFFGNPLQVGTIAVDSDVIPLGTKVYITGYDFNGLPAGGMVAVASDKGGAIKGNRIDIFVPTSRQKAMDFGVQSVKIYVLE